MSRKRKPSKFANLVGTLLLIGCIAALYMFMPVAITKENVEKHLQLFNTYVSKQSTDNNKEGSFTWGDISLEGWGFEKQALIANPSINLTDKIDGSKWTIATPSAVATPDRSPDILHFAVPGAITLSLNGDLKQTMTFSAPPKYSYFDGNREGMHTLEHDFKLPSQITLTPAKTTDDRGDKISTVVISYDGMPVLRSTVKPEAGERTILAEFSNLRISTDQVEQVVVTTLMSRYSEKKLPENAVEGSYSLMMTDLLLSQADGVMTPYSFSGDFKFATVPPAPLPTDVNPETTTPPKASTEFTISKMQLIASEFEIKLEGKVVASPDDPLLSGDILLEIKNAGNFLASKLVPSEVKPIVESALLKISGQAIDATTTVSLPIKREKNGTLYIGSLTFEELTAAIFADIMANQPTVTHLPENPPANAPGAAPVSPVATTPPPAVNLGILPTPPAPPAPAEKK